MLRNLIEKKPWRIKKMMSHQKMLAEMKSASKVLYRMTVSL